MLDRHGRVWRVVVGDAHGLVLPPIPSRGFHRLCGLRLIHTHLNGEPLSEEDLTDLIALRLDYIGALHFSPDGQPTFLHGAHLLPENPHQTPWRILESIRITDVGEDFPQWIAALEEEFERNHSRLRAASHLAGAILVHVSELPFTSAQARIEELRSLAQHVGVAVRDTVIQRRPPDAQYVLGKGRLRQTLIRALQVGAEFLIFDQNLTPSQLKALTEFTDLKILDRTQIILDIFAQHATTREGKIQVELAQLEYRIPFLGLKQNALSRLSGGIGGRGPGETVLEIEKRRVYAKKAILEKELQHLSARRKLQQNQRIQRNVPVIALVGYTNVGKSALLNALTRGGATVQNAPFVTLHPLTRRCRLTDTHTVILSDTVGFIRDMPERIRAAFRATLDELHQADLLLHVVDATSEEIDMQERCVNALLQEMHLSEKPILYVINKTDRAAPEVVHSLCLRYNAVPVSALQEHTLPALRARIVWELKQSGILHNDIVPQTAPTYTERLGNVPV